MTPATGCTPTSPRPSSPRCAPSSPPTDGARRETETAPRPADAPLRSVRSGGVTFAQNALKKARAVAAHTGLIAVADDSGLA
ncbi:non-canonical purine NTP pyrophosphatase, partial [Micrococcus luteus]